MNIFLDTSSLFKLYFQEGDSAQLDELFEQHSVERIYLSGLATIEFRSIVWRKVRMNEITGQQGALLLDAFDRDYTTYKFVSIDEYLCQVACHLLDKYGQIGLRSLDSIQLASAITLREDVQLFKTADILLNNLFIAEALPVVLL